MIEKAIEGLIDTAKDGIKLSQSQLMAMGATGKAVIQKTSYDTNAVIIEHECGTIELHIPGNAELDKDVEGLSKMKFMDHTSTAFQESYTYKLNMEKYFGVIFPSEEGGYRVQVSKKIPS